VAIHELLEITEELRELIHQQAPDHTIRQMARQHGMRTLLEDGIAKAAMGLTTLDEVLRVAPSMEVHNRPPSPTSVAIAAPAAAAAPRPTLPSASVPTEGAAPALVPPHILVLEDHVDTQALLQLILEKNGYMVTIVGDGIEALMQMGSKKFDLILSDLNMPNMDGMQLLEVKNQKKLEVPVILLTADDTEECEMKCLELGAVDYIKSQSRKIFYF
jgi:CheY-like chemotaxis protein